MGFPKLFYKYFLNNVSEIETSVPIKPYKIGIKGRWLKIDTVHLGAVLKGKPQGWNAKFPGKISTIWNYLRFCQKNLIYFNIKKYDPLPGIIEFFKLFCPDVLGLR